MEMNRGAPLRPGLRVNVKQAVSGGRWTNSVSSWTLTNTEAIVVCSGGGGRSSREMVLQTRQKEERVRTMRVRRWTPWLVVLFILN